MALLMAVFRYQPSPFCVMDEVDAPLDEVNIGRLTRLIQEMSLQTQFVMITHSKRTMEAAQSLYGVTMQEPGVSRLVSVKMDAKAEAAA
jgi:chromosome segregation protein